MLNQLTIDDIPSKDVISQDLFDSEILEEYRHGSLILSSGGINEQNVVCCKTCLRHLQNGKLPQLSIANQFQFGKAPPELCDLTLPKKLLIAFYRPKMYVATLRSFASPGTAQYAIKGNTITFPQDVAKIVESLPANPNILANHLVVFIGNGAPSRELLKKVFKVR